MLVLRALAQAGLALAALAFAQGAAAQGYDSNTHVRVGAFALGYGTRVHTVKDGVDLGTGTIGNHGFGLSAGLDWVQRGYLLGVEADLAATEGNATLGSDRFGQNFVATGRVRAGLFVNPSWLLYGTVGIAATAVSLHSPVAVKYSHVQQGLTFGGGAEYALTRSTLVFAEYLHADGGTWRQNSNNILNNNYATGLDSHMIKLGVKFKVGFDTGYHDDVAERIGRRH